MTHAEYIAKDLRHKILTACGLPEKLTLERVAGLYGVSLMPVRIALESLIKADLIIKEPSGRLTVNSRKLGSRPNDKAMPQAPEDWFKKISTDLVHLSLKGGNNAVTIPDTAARYGLGRTAVQTILTRLAGLGILDHESRRGWTVRPFREEDLNAYLEIRELLELRALLLARPRLVQSDLRRMLDLSQPASGLQPAFVDDSLHGYWIDRSNNRYIKEFYYREGAYYRVLYEYASTGEALKSTLAAQHQAILNALLQEKWRDAEAALSHDIRSLQPILDQARQSMLVKSSR
jgi:DNA-binding GntR family transcriptional regulator